MSWTPGRVEQLKTLAASGLTTREIAARLGFVTRNSVIGKIHRLGIDMPPKRKPPASEDNLHPHDLSEASFEAAVIAIKADTAAPLSIRPSYAMVGAKPCQWPSGDCVPYTFCGAGAVEGKPYCEDHCRIAYRKPGEYR